MTAKKPPTRTLEEINAKLATGRAIVMTASELCQSVRNGRDVAFAEIDIVTAATCGLMSGTYAVLSFPFAEPNRFTKAERVWFNDIEGYPGPCPNERIGLIDAIVYGTRHSETDPRYGGGHLLRDMVAGKPIDVRVETTDGEMLSRALTLADIPHAMLHGSRHAFRNYVGFVNPGSDPVPTIFCSQPLPPDLAGATACGCGEINPIQKDPTLRTIGVGSRVLVNGGLGIVMGPGTRATSGRPCLSVVADMHGMNPCLMGGFQTSAGPEVIQTWAVAIPILDGEILKRAKVGDRDIPLSITDINGRREITQGTYADLWQGNTSLFSFDEHACHNVRDRCRNCPPALLCPSGAFTDRKVEIDQKRCFHCGICSVSCYGSCFTGTMGSVEVQGRKVPFIQRLSDRTTAMNAASELKKQLLEGGFVPNAPVERIVLA